MRIWFAVLMLWTADGRGYGTVKGFHSEAECIAGELAHRKQHGTDPSDCVDVSMAQWGIIISHAGRIIWTKEQ